MNLFLRRFANVTNAIPSLIIRRVASQTDLLTKELLLAVKDNKAENRFQKTVLELESFDAHWGKNLKEHRTISSIANDLVKKKRFEDFDFLVEKMGLANCSLGMKTTILKCYIERQIWNEAIQLFNELEEKVKHLRLYHDIIQGFSTDQNIEMANMYFKKLLRKEKDFSFKRHIKVSQTSLGQYLKAISQSSNLLMKMELTETALEYMQQGDYLANNEISESLICIFRSLDLLTRISSLTDKQLCPTCDTKLNIVDDFSEVLKEVSQNIEKHLIQIGSHSYLQKISQNFNGNRYYRYIVDVANVLCSQTKHQPDLKRLKNVLDSIVQQNRYDTHIVLVLPRGGIVKSVDLSQYIRHLCQSFVLSCQVDIVASRKLDEDLLVLYLSAKSTEIAGNHQKVNIVSNDFFAEYGYLVPDEQQERMFRWLRDSVKRFDIEGNVVCKPYVPVVVMDENKIHIRCDDGQILCVSKN